MSSAAAEGVGARRSATKSAMVKSVSWPMAETVGSADAAMAAGEALGVEAGEVFEGAAAAGDEDEVDAVGVLIEPADAGGDGGCAPRALDCSGIDEEIEAGVAAARDFDNVVEDGSPGGGDDSDAVGEGGEGALAGCIEEAFGEQAGFELFEGELECAGARGSRVSAMSWSWPRDS